MDHLADAGDDDVGLGDGGVGGGVIERGGRCGGGKGGEGGEDGDVRADHFAVVALDVFEESLDGGELALELEAEALFDPCHGATEEPGESEGIGRGGEEGGHWGRVVGVARG